MIGYISGTFGTPADCRSSLGSFVDRGPGNRQIVCVFQNVFQIEFGVDGDQQKWASRGDPEETINRRTRRSESSMFSMFDCH